MSQPEVLTLLRDGMAAARRGDKALTRKLLRQAVALDPRNETVWLWLGGVGESPRDTLDCLLHVLELNPANERAQTGLKSAYLLAGVDAAKAENRPQAHAWLTEAARRDPGNETAWLWLAGVTDQPAEAIAHLERVLTINPANERARQGAAYYRKQLADAAPVWHCPLCEARVDQADDKCRACSAALSLKNAELFLHNPSLRRDVVKKALDRLARAAETDPSFHSLFHVALALLNLGKTEDAALFLQAAQGHKPGDAEFRSLSNSLNRRLQQAEEVLRSRKVQEEARLKEAQRRTILVVDDSPTVRKLVAMTLEKANHRVVAAAEPQEAIEKMRNHGVPDLIFLDINMPTMDGYQFCKFLRQNKETAKLPIIMLSGKDGMFSKLRGSWAGSTEYVTKPFKPEKLLQVVDKYCKDVAHAKARAASASAV